MGIALSKLLYVGYYLATAKEEITEPLSLNSTEFRGHGPLTLAIRPTLYPMWTTWGSVVEIWSVATMDFDAYHTAALCDFNELKLEFAPAAETKTGRG